MSTLIHCITKAGKLLSKSDIKMLKDSHAKYLAAGMSNVEAAQKATEDFVLNAHDKVTGYEKEIEVKGGDLDPDVFNLADTLAGVKKVPPVTEPLKEDDLVEAQVDIQESPDYLTEDIYVSGDPSVPRRRRVAGTGYIAGQKVTWTEVPHTPEIDMEFDEVLTEIMAEVAAGELDLNQDDVQKLETMAETKDMPPIGLRMIAHKQSGRIGEIGENVENFNAEEQELVARTFAGKPPVKKIKDAMVDTLVNGKTKLRQTVVDQFASFNSILKDPTSWMLANVTASSSQALEATIHDGRPFLDSEGVIGIDSSQKSVDDVLAPLGENLNRWVYYIVGNRAEKLFAQDKEHLFTEDDIKVMKNMNKGDEELFESVRVDFEELAAANIQIGIDTGLINAEEGAMWIEEGFYLPFARVLTEGDTRGPRVIGNAGLVRQQAYKRLKGGTQQLDNPLANAVLNWGHILDASLKNQAGLKAIDSAVKLGMAYRITKEKASKKAIYLRRNGKEVWYEVDEPLVLDSLNSLNWEGLNGRLMKTLRVFKRALTVGVTASPEFKVANLVRDSLTALATTDVSLNIAKNLSQGWDATKKGSEIEIAMRAGGAIFGQSGYIHGSDPEAISHLVKKGIKPETVLDSVGKYANVWKHYQDLGARLENINRAADYVQTLARGEGTLKATFNARDHLDFTRTGSAKWVRAMSQIVPFLNARLQGIDKLARAAPGSIKQLINPKEAAKFKTVIATYSLAAIGMYLAIKDDEDYRGLEEWEKRTYHHFKIPFVEGLFRIPRPFEVGSIGYAAESVIHLMVDDEAHGELFAERMAHTLTDTFAFNPIPQAVKPAIEVAMNRNFFTGRAIESPYVHISDLSPVRRKRVWTSETAIAVSKGMDKISWGKVVLSPIQIEHLVQGYLGWAGATTLSATDMLLTRPLTNAPTQPPMKFSEYPIMKRFMTTLPSKNTRYTSNFYSTLKEINNAYTDIRDAKKMRDFEEVERLMKEKGAKLKLRAFYVKQQKRIAKINQRMNLIKGSNMEPVAKGRELDRLTIFKNSLTKQIAGKTERFKAALEAGKAAGETED